VERRGSTRTAVVWEVLRTEVERAAAVRPVLSVVDVGGGTGGFAVPLARQGHQVTVVDASPDALAALTRRAAEAGVGARVHAVQGDADALADLVEPGSADIVLCHSVLEVVDSPADVAAALAATLRPAPAGRPAARPASWSRAGSRRCSPGPWPASSTPRQRCCATAPRARGTRCADGSMWTPRPAC
jgi:2-polyprenyl-3-methyl-5-hydroxy-6-metoxy-1,4-benzoquinol methylase